MAILVVDDERHLRQIVGEELTEAGYQVDLAASADEAIARIQATGPFELVLTDVRMPGSMDGLGLARWLRANAPRTRIFIISGYVGETTPEPPLFDAFMSKPLPFAKLRVTVERLMTRGAS